MKDVLKLFKWWELAFVCFALTVMICLSVVFKASVPTIFNTVLALVGVSLLAKGLVLGNLIMICQCVFYCWMNTINGYYGEVIVAVCISVPLYLLALINWMRKKSDTNEVTVNTNLKAKDYLFGVLLDVVLTVIVFFVMRAFNTTNIAISTFSVFACILAAYLSIRRSWLNFVFYILNNSCQFVMWMLIVVQTGQIEYYVSVVHYFFSIVFNAYAIFNWQKLAKLQRQEDNFDMVMKIVRSQV